MFPEYKNDPKNEKNKDILYPALFRKNKSMKRFIAELNI